MLYPGPLGRVPYLSTGKSFAISISLCALDHSGSCSYGPIVCPDHILRSIAGGGDARRLQVVRITFTDLPCAPPRQFQKTGRALPAGHSMGTTSVRWKTCRRYSGTRVSIEKLIVACHHTDMAGGTS